MNIRRIFSTVAVALLALASVAPIAFAQGGAKPLGVVAISSYDELMSDVDFIGSLANVPGLSQQLEMPINMFTQGKGLVGLDQTQPIGVVLQADESGVMFGGALCLPVSDMEGLLGVLAPFGVIGNDKGNGSYEISAGGQNMYAKVEGGWAFIAPMEPMLASLPANPGQMIGDLNKQFDLGLQVNMQNIPEAYRQQLFELFNQAAQQGIQQEANESDGDFAQRRAAFSAQLDQAQQQMADMDQVTVGLAIDNQQQRAYLDFAYTALPGSKLAEQLAANTETKTNYAGFFQPDSAMMASFASQVAATEVAQIEQQLAGAKQQIYKAIEDEAELANDESKELMKGAVDDFMEALASTLKEGVIDGGAVLTLNSNALTFVAGGVVADTTKVEEGLKKLEEVSAKEDLGMPAVNWNSQSYGDLKFHTMSHPTDADDEGAQQLFGEVFELAVGIGENSVMVAAGRNWLDAVKKVIDDSQANPNKSVPPMEMTVSLGPIMAAAADLADEDEKPMLEMISNMLENEASGRDKVRITTTMIPNGARARFEMEEGVLRAIGVAVMQSQMQAAGAGF